MNNINDIRTSFKLPISFCSKITKLDSNIISDLELIPESNPEEKEDLEKSKSLYQSIFNPKTKLGETLLDSWTESFSYDKKFLQSSQKIYSSTNVVPMEDVDEIHKTWLTLKNDTGFIQKYQYIDWEFFHSLNSNSQFLQVMSIYSLTSPIVSLILPLLLCIVPFFLLKFQNVKISLNTYFEILKKLFIKHIPIGKLAVFNEMAMSDKVYTVISIMFYFFQIYQNILSCWKFYKNQYHIENVLNKFKVFIEHTINQSNEFLKVSEKHVPFFLFNEYLKSKLTRLMKLKDYLQKILKFKIGIKEISNIGYTMKHFYEFYKNKEVKDTMNYAFGLNAYFDQINGIQFLLNTKKINKCLYSKNKCFFKNAYYPLIEYESAIKNTYSLKSNILITGPNAAGKTTLLKATLFNILLSQQIGFGFFKSAKIVPFKYLHCYLNIPDTSGRDSLFQAEARRCKDILDKINDSKKVEKHFCIFDEIYSGTNPYEATASAYSYLEHLSQQNNVDFMITTHYIELCGKLNQKNIKNYHMFIQKNNKNIEYTYLLKEGVSDIKGGINVLKDLGYPDEMIENTGKFLNNS